MSSEDDKRVNPLVLQTALLDEIAQRLMELQKQLPEKPIGMVEPLSPVHVTTDARVVFPPMKKKWFSVSIVNDGPSDCWVVVNTEKSPPQPYLTRVGEAYEAGFGYPAIEDIRVYTENGTANLRIKGVR